MLPTTLDAVKAMLKADPTITVEERSWIVASIRNHGRESPTKPAVPVEKRIMRRKEAAARLGVSSRTVDHLAKQGVLRRVLLPGRQRACGFVADEVERLLAAGSQA